MYLLKKSQFIQKSKSIIDSVWDISGTEKWQKPGKSLLFLHFYGLGNIKNIAGLI